MLSAYRSGTGERGRHVTRPARASEPAAHGTPPGHDDVRFGIQAVTHSPVYDLVVVQDERPQGRGGGEGEGETMGPVRVRAFTDVGPATAARCLAVHGGLDRGPSGPLGAPRWRSLALWQRAER